MTIGVRGNELIGGEPGIDLFARGHVESFGCLREMSHAGHGLDDSRDRPIVGLSRAFKVPLFQGDRP